MDDVSQIGKPKPSKRKWSDMIIFSLFAFLIGMTIMLVAASMVVPTIINKTVDTYTDVGPMAMPVIEHDEALQEEVEERLDSFVAALTGEDVIGEEGVGSTEIVDELMLNEAELNALLHGDENLRDTVRLSFHDGRLRTQLSIPLESDVDLGPWRASMRGRYINGVAEMELGLGESGLAVELVSFEVSGKQVPDWLLGKLQEEIEGEDFWASAEVQEVVEQLGGVEILGDLLILSPKGA